jgi:hypothetical protein
VAGRLRGAPLLIPWTRRSGDRRAERLEAPPAEDARDVEDAAVQGPGIGQITPVQLVLRYGRLLGVDLEHEHEDPLVAGVLLRSLGIDTDVGI